MVRIRVNKKVVIVIPVFILWLLTLLPLYSLAENGVDVTISILKNKELEKYGRKVFVTGVWNWINISFNKNVSRVNITLYKGDNLPLTKNEENFYAWSYDGDWKAITAYDGNEYIDKENSKKIGNEICFRVSTENIVEDDFENWTLSIKYDENEITIPIILEKPLRSLAVTGGITVNVEPFQTVTAYGDHYFTTMNNGNLPMIINVSYNRLSDRIVTSNTNVILCPGEELKHSVEIKTQAWKPGIITIGGTVTGVVPDDIIPTFITSQPTIQLNTAFMLSPGSLIKIIVGHSTYELEEIEGGNLTFQYKKEVEIHRDEERNVTSFLCGEGNVTLSIHAQNLSIVGVWLDGDKISNYENITIQLNPLQENQIDVRIKALPEVEAGKIIYKLTTEDREYSYETTIKIKEPEENPGIEKREDILPKILVGLGIIFAISYIAVTYIRGRK